MSDIIKLFKPGAQVTLKGSSRVMVVNQLGFTKDEVMVVWFSEGELESAWLNAAVLEAVPTEE